MNPDSGPARIVSALKAAGVRFIVELPETWLVPLVRLLKDHPDFVDVPVAREDEGVGVCAGLELGGQVAALLIQNTGLLASANALATLPLKHRIPLLMLISHRGAPGMRDSSDYHLLEGEVTRPVLDALRIPTFEVNRPLEADRIQMARERATLGRQPVAVLLGQEALQL
jgi:sulfopyruvate decarboxylase subunit alpha